jgi:hypothetical protein
VQESCTLGSVRGVSGNAHPYRVKLWKIASAELIPANEGSTYAIAMRDSADSPGSENVSRMQSSRWNLRDPIESGMVVHAGGMRRGTTGAVRRVEVGSRTDS